MQMKEKTRILFLCTGNSCRSQMAEAWTRHLKNDFFDAYSAGVETHGLNPLAVEVMKEAGIDISGQKSKTVDNIAGISFDYVITVCDHAQQVCPFFPAKIKIIHKSFDDPPKLAARAESKEEAISHYRRVRDEIKEYIQSLPGSLENENR
jgi:arsenate reductase